MFTYTARSSYKSPAFYGTRAAIYFTLSTVITWWFIVASPLYASLQQQLLSCSIAGCKWALQIAAALLLLRSKKWLFIYQISIACFIGSIILLPFCISSYCFGYNSTTAFIASLVAAVSAMEFVYFLAVKKCEISIAWFAAWLACLAIAIALQLTIVFHVF